jgi:hypothetical protein
MIRNLGDTIFVCVDGLNYNCAIVAVDTASFYCTYYLLEPRNTIGITQGRLYIIGSSTVKEYLNGGVKCDSSLAGKTILRSHCDGWIWWSEERLDGCIRSDNIDVNNNDRGGLKFL